jgi:hypothetical protein
MKRWLAVLASALVLSNAIVAQDNSIKIDVANSAVNAPLTIPLSVSKEHSTLTEVAVDFITNRDVPQAVGQLTAPGIVTEAVKPAKDGLIRLDLHVVVTTPCMGLIVHLKPAKPQVIRFAWTEKKGEYAELILTRSGTFTPYLRYMNRPYDASSADARNKSYKVFHHLYDPTGKRFVTNGGHTDENIRSEEAPISAPSRHHVRLQQMHLWPRPQAASRHLALPAAERQEEGRQRRPCRT